VLKQQQPTLRARNAAALLGVSEAQLLACRGDLQAIRLREDWPAVLAEVAHIGDVMALTRNEYCVHERHGVYDNLSFSGKNATQMGMALNPEIDLRLFLNRWRFGFAVSEPLKNGERHSLQFFDGSGNAVHKIYLTANSDVAAYQTLVERFRSTAALWPEVEAAPEPQGSAVGYPNAIDASALEQDWRSLRDVHEFFPMLRKHSVNRLSALQLMPADLANQVPLGSVQCALQQAACKECEIMVFVGNRGCIQIHTGPVGNLRQIGPWFNVL
ncbi:MAG: hypothetical protein OIF34_09265, partial [Porticoccaceae bacterium]|nr:hypothetical protein [Porticoccaceae bacterium]